MIYFKPEILKFSKHFIENPTEIILVNDVSQNVYNFDFTNTSDDDRFYEIDFTNISLPNGTYTYHIGKDTGLLQVGDYTCEKTVYEEKKENVVYEK